MKSSQLKAVSGGNPKAARRQARPAGQAPAGPVAGQTIGKPMPEMANIVFKLSAKERTRAFVLAEEYFRAGSYLLQFARHGEIMAGGFNAGASASAVIAYYVDSAAGMFEALNKAQWPEVATMKEAFLAERGIA